MLVQGFSTLPIGTTGLSNDALWMLVTWGTQIFAGALAVALPGITALLIVNLAFGVVSRAAPTLNLFAVGFPISLVFGLVIVLVGLPGLQSSFVSLMAAGVRAPRGSAVGARHGRERSQNAQNNRHRNGSTRRARRARFRARVELNTAAVVLIAGAAPASARRRISPAACRT